MDYEQYKNFVFIRVIKALSSETRLDILKLLFKKGPLDEKTISDRILSTEANVSYHINKLKTARLVDVGIRGKFRIISINNDSRMELNQSLLRTLKIWFSKKEGKKRDQEKSFLESILSQGKMSSLRNTLKSAEKREGKRKK